MKVSARWLHDLVPGLDLGPEALAEHLALRGAPVEEITSPGRGLGDIVVATVLDAGPHPNADRLSLCTVDAGRGAVQVVCGAPNVKAGASYPFAPVGAVLPGGLEIKKAKIRGEVSEGMLCSPKELGLGSDHAGILEMQGRHIPGQPFVEAHGLDDSTLDVEVTVNRGDLLSHVGVARELAGLGEGRVVLPPVPGRPEVALDYREGAPEVSNGQVCIRIEDPELCGRYVGAIVRGVRIGPSPEWLQRRLRGAGARPINNVVDATNYVMLELGQPLHAFDLARLEGPSIVVRRARADEAAFTTLDEVERRLASDMLMICDAERPVAVAGVMGGLRSEVGDETVDILLECALFDPKSIRATRRSLAMSTDASYRFERGVDPQGMRLAVERAVAVILAAAGGSVDGPVLDCNPRPFETEVIPLRLARIEHLLGVPFGSERVHELLAPLGFDVVDESEGTLRVRVPGFRSYDVRREVDLIEEIARAHGYDAFPAELRPYRPGTVPDDPMFQLEEELRSALVGRGLLEAHTPAFVPREEGDLEISNPVAATEPCLRRALLPSLLRRIEYNFARGNRDVRLFELGTSFRLAGDGVAPEERTHLAAVLAGRSAPPHWSGPDRSLDVWDLKSLLEEVARKAYRERAGVEPAPGAAEHGSATRDAHDAATPTGPEGSAIMDESTCFVVRDQSATEVGRGGRVADGVLDAPPWAGDVWALEIVLPTPVAPRPVAVHSPLPQFPAVERDLALVVPDGLDAARVADTIRASAGSLLEGMEVFDLYRGHGVREGARSLAFSLRFRAPERTLKDEEVDRAVQTVLARLEEELGVEPRG